MIVRPDYRPAFLNRTLIETYFCNPFVGDKFIVHRSLAGWFSKRREAKKNENLGKKHLVSIISSNQNGPQRMISINYLFRNANSFSIWSLWFALKKIRGKIFFFCSFWPSFDTKQYPYVTDYFHFLLKIC